MPHRENTSALSDDSLVATIVTSFAELVRRELQRSMSGLSVQPVRKIRLDLPFSRAEGRDYLRIVELWNTYRKSNKQQLPARACPACGSDASRFIFQSYDQYPYHACEVCGTWFVPLIIDEKLFDAFRVAVPEAREISEFMMSGRDTVTRESDRQRFRQYFEMLAPFWRNGSRALRYLDIGCGVGHSVDVARELGWQAIGVEPNKTAAETAQKAGRNVVRSLDWSTGRYDIISLFETLEHVTDPAALMREISGVLTAGGIIMITVPQCASLELSIMREHSFHVFGGSEGVGHINLFNERGISTLLERHGLRLLYVDSQFSSSIFQIFDCLAENRYGALDYIRDGHVELTMTEASHNLINNLGPAMSVIERALGRSPILIGIGCRTSDHEMLRPAFESLQRAWREEVLRLIESI
jgi:SAM-dependent methyltransferase